MRMQEPLMTINEVAEFFKRMADIEWIHVYHVGELSREMGGEDGTPTRASAGARLEGAELPDMEDMHYMQRPYHAIALAMKYEQRAVDYYSRIVKSTTNEQVRTAARRLVSEEEMHVRELERWLARYPKPEDGWDEDPDPPVAQE